MRRVRVRQVCSGLVRKDQAGLRRLGWDSFGVIGRGEAGNAGYGSERTGEVWQVGFGYVWSGRVRQVGRGSARFVVVGLGRLGGVWCVKAG